MVYYLSLFHKVFPHIPQKCFAGYIVFFYTLFFPSAYAISPKDGYVFKPVEVTPIAERTWAIIDHSVFPFLGLFVLGLLVLLMYMSWRFFESRHPNVSQVKNNIFIQLVWLAIPIGFLGMVTPSVVAMINKASYTENPDVIVTVTGLSDGWRFEYNGENVIFESRGIHENHLKPGQRRLMSTDNPLVLPEASNIQLYFTSEQGAKRWVVPELGINAHLRNGRKNPLWLYTEEPGNYYGFCGVSCGDTHVSMPIEIRIIPRREFASWIDIYRENIAEKR